MGTLHYSFPKQCFLIASACWASSQSFWKESWRVQVAHLHNGARALSSRSRCFQLSTNRFLSLSLMLWYKTNRMWLSVVCILIDNDTGHHSRHDLLWNHWFIHACRHKQNVHGNLNGFLVSLAQFSHLTFEACHSELCGVFGIPRNGIFSFIKLISSSDTLTKREAAVLKICAPAIITSAEVII